MSFYNGSKWNEDATELCPHINKKANELAKKFKAKGGEVVDDLSEEAMLARFMRADRISRNLGFRLNRSPHKRRRKVSRSKK